MADSSNNKKFYVTTPIYYVNARPHIGHAYTTLVADTIARRHRLLGDDTWFLTGTDEHGQKIERSAAAAGIPPQQFADEVSDTFRSLWKRMGITNDDYIRTTEPRHQRGVQRLWRLLEERGQIYLSSYTGQYSIGEEMFVDGPPGTIGPDGKPTETVTEENYFFRLGDYQRRLIDLIESGDEFVVQPEVRKNEVLSFLRGNVAEAASTELSNAGIPYVPGALKDLSISRSSFKWGIPVPGNEKHVIYVWLDALANYMTALGYGSDEPADIARFEKYWPADLHLVGKEIIRFHCVYWPAFLLAAELSLPNKVQAHGWLLFEESKMSKSRGNIVRSETILDAFGTEVYAKQFPDSTKAEQDLFATDVLRYFLLREIPFGQDGSFSLDAVIIRYNADLANGYGNLVSRTLSMIQKYFESTLPSFPPEKSITEQLSKLDELFARWQSNLSLTDNNPNDTRAFISSFGDVFNKKLDQELDFTSALYSAQMMVSTTDQMLTASAPWKINQETAEGRNLTGEILYTAAESIRIITALLYPILPTATAKVWAQLGLGDIEAAAKSGALNNLSWGGLKPGTKLGALGPIFPRADKGLAQIMTDMEAAKNAPKSTLTDELTPATPEQHDPLHPAAPLRPLDIPNPGVTVAGSHASTTERVHTPHQEATPSGPFAASAHAEAEENQIAPQIAIDDFVKIDLRVAQILVAERIPKADKLLRLEVDLGFEKRQILSGIAQWYTPEELIGRRIVVIANLAPRKMRGLESHGMLLAASHGEDGKPVLATFGEEIELGSRLK